MFRSILRSLTPFAIYPTVILGGGGILIAGVGLGYPAGLLSVPLLILALVGALLLERVLPFHQDWLRPRGDFRTDLLHGVAGLALSWGAMAIYTWVGPRITLSGGLWPHQWPLVMQVLLAGLVVDLGLYVMHRLSHAIPWLWRFHAIHHGPERLYALNGERRHPLHFLIEGSPGLLIAGLLGVPPMVMACFLAIFHLHLLLQHGNIAYRAGWLRFAFAVAENHRWHHRKAAADSSVNFGGFFAIWDHLFRTSFSDEGKVEPDGVGIEEEPDFPKGYLAQLAYPFKG